MLNAIQTGIFTPSTKQRLIDSFVNAVYLYEDKIILTFNYKDGSKTITLAEVEGSDLSVLGASHGGDRKVAAFVVYRILLYLV